MRRRDFLKTTGALLAGATVAAPGVASEAPSSRISGRTILPINRNWKYSRKWTDAAAAADFDDSSFERVVVPHTNIALPWHSFDDKSYEFVSAYRRRFNLPAALRGQRVFVDFEGVMTASTVWVNGTRLGEYKGGFTPFSFELTDHVHWNAENVLVVQVDSTERADIPPFGYQIDYLTFGGIYREVALRIVPQIFLENIFARPKDVLTDTPSLDVQCFLQSSGTLPDNLSLEVTLAREGKAVGHVSKRVERSSSQESLTPVTIALNNFGKVDLWDLT